MKVTLQFTSDSLLVESFSKPFDCKKDAVEHVKEKFKLRSQDATYLLTFGDLETKLGYFEFVKG